MKIRTNIEVANRDFYKTMFELSLYHRMKLPYDEVLEYINAIGGYNEFEANRVKQMLYEIDQIIPRVYYNPKNPNNGKQNFELEIGREGSPVIYLTVREFSKDRQHIIDDLLDLVPAIKRVAESVGKCDEFNQDLEVFPILGGRQVQIRMWWD